MSEQPTERRECSLCGHAEHIGRCWYSTPMNYHFGYHHDCQCPGGIAMPDESPTLVLRGTSEHPAVYKTSDGKLTASPKPMPDEPAARSTSALFDPEFMAQNSAAVAAMPDWAKGSRNLREPAAPVRACVELNPELPACAAIRYGSVIIAGKRHHDCIASAAELGFMKRSHVSETQGFMTTRGRFVNRVDAKLLMERAGRESADPEGYRGGQLYSEDLY